MHNNCSAKICNYWPENIYNFGLIMYCIIVLMEQELKEE